jgi:hypothetical protein
MACTARLASGVTTKALFGCQCWAETVAQLHADCRDERISALLSIVIPIMTVRAILSIDMDNNIVFVLASSSITLPAYLSSSAQTGHDSGDGANKTARAA